MSAASAWAPTAIAVAAATAIAVGAHAEAADMAWQEQGVGLTPSDVVERLGGVLTQV